MIGHPGAEASVFAAIRASPRSGRVVLAVGPEGGWTSGELDCFSRQGFVPVSLRDRALRTDTAVIALLAVIYEALA